MPELMVVPISVMPARSCRHPDRDTIGADTRSRQIRWAHAHAFRTGIASTGSSTTSGCHGTRGPARLAQARELGLEGVSIYVPWNWHQPSPGPIDFTGRTLPERDLLGALDRIAAAGLTCIYRPGPFITAEWRDGGIPAWLWQGDPSMLALDAAGRPAGAGRPYPALTYAHPGYESAAADWLTAAIGAVSGYFATSGGPIVHLQIDDEPSWWQQLRDPLALDYNAFLVAPRDAQPSRYAAWLLGRHGGLDALNRAHRTTLQAVTEIEPPREVITDRAQLPRSLDWLEFKLAVINEHIAVLHAAARSAGFDGPVSMLQPYLLPLQAATFAAFARERLPDLELTNECYVSLFSATSSPEQKVAHVIATHESYHMWRGPDQGPAFSMELQGSNSSFISPGVMETLYAVTLARGIRGWNIYMLVGGQNPPGYELGTGREYDLGAPIGMGGDLRPHAAVLARQVRVVRAIERELVTRNPCATRGSPPTCPMRVRQSSAAPAPSPTHERRWTGSSRSVTSACRTRPA